VRAGDGAVPPSPAPADSISIFCVKASVVSLILLRIPCNNRERTQKAHYPLFSYGPALIPGVYDHSRHPNYIFFVMGGIFVLALVFWLTAILSGGIVNWKSQPYLTAFL
jgi:protein-S-isoprenylcysteine O-methyltransferase Ste14